MGYQYDENLRLAQVTDGDHPIHYNYDNFGRLTEKAFNNGAKTEYAYNDLGRLSSLTHSRQNELLDKYIYSYDVMGNKTSIEKQRQGIDEDSGLFGYSYDAMNRLSEVTKDGNPLRSYSYDVFGNRTSMTSGDEEIDYTFNHLNQLISSTDGMSYHYDKRGNQVEVFKNGTLTNKHHFGASNRLEQSVNHEKELSSVYKYNGLGHRMGQTIGDLELNPVKEIENILDYTRSFHNLLQRKEDGAIQQFTYDFGVLSAQNGEQTLNYLHDELGSPIRLLDGIGSELDAFGYDEFGVQFGTTSCVKQPFDFTGYSTDSVSDTLFAQAREYDPVAGRFISEDLIKGFTHIPLTQNAYNYVWNNPLNLVDFNGMYPELPYGHLDPAIYCQETGIPHGASVPIGANMDIRGELRTISDWFGHRWNDVTSWWNSNVFGSREVEVISAGGPNGMVGFYTSGQTTTVRPSETQTGRLITRTTTIENGRPSTGLSFNPSITSILGVFGIENNSRINLGSSFGGTVSRSGFSINTSTSFQLGQLRGGLSGNSGLSTTDWFNVNASAYVGWGEHSVGGGIHTPTSPWGHLRLFGFHEETSGSTIRRSEIGGHIQMGSVYVAVALLFLWKFSPLWAPFIEPLIQPGINTSSVSSILLALRGISTGFDNTCEGEEAI